MKAIADHEKDEIVLSIEFDKQKAKSLSGIDNSRKGSVDSRIIELVDFINQLEDFFTTSSCSGRLALISGVCFERFCIYYDCQRSDF